MASDSPVYPTPARDHSSAAGERTRGQAATGLKGSLDAILRPFASLKLTVALFAFAIVSVLITTLAQATRDIWFVIDTYVRVDLGRIFTAEFPWFNPLHFIQEMFVMVPVQVLFPPSFFPQMETIGGSFPFPKGWLIGLLMMLNLVAAHFVRFRSQAKGTRLWLGWAVIAFGCVVTWAVIASGSDHDGVQTDYSINWSTLWRILQVSLVMVILSMGYGLFGLKKEQHLHRSLLVLGIILVLPLLIWMFLAGGDVPIDDSGMRILWQLLKGIIAGGVLLAGCSIVFKKRAGIVLLHAGVGLMMFYEVFVGVSADEGQMLIVEGETVNYARDNRSFELAIAKPLNDETEHVTVVPQKIFYEYVPKLNRKDADEPPPRIEHDELPFVVQIEEFHQNAQLIRATAEAQERVTGGIGKQFMAEGVMPSSGASSSEAVDQPAAYVALYDKRDPQQLIGRHLVAASLDFTGESDSVTVGEDRYSIALRFKRVYKPYSIKLEDVRKVDYEGTDIPRDYSSDIVLKSEEGSNVETRIWMNNPLRYGGETFYQSSYGELSGGKEYTILQVVTNSGWMIPYVSCMIVGVGMLAQFMITLTRFLNRKSAAEDLPVSLDEGHSLYDLLGVTAAASHNEIRKSYQKLSKQYHPDANPGDQEAVERHRAIEEAWDILGTRDKRAAYDETLSTQGGTTETGWKRKVGTWFPVVATVLVALWLGGRLSEPKVPQDDYNLYAFGQIPIRDGGRLKPMDTLARNTLRFLSRRNDFEDKNKQRQPAIRFLLDLSNGEIRPNEQTGRSEPVTAADGYRLFYIENFHVQEFLGLERRKGFLYSYDEFRPRVPKLVQHLAEDAERRRTSDAEQTKKDPDFLLNLKLREVYRKIEMYHNTANAFIPAVDLPPRPDLSNLGPDNQEAMAAAMRVKQLFETYPQFLEAIKAPLLIPMLDEEQEKYQGKWEAYPMSQLKAQFNQDWLGRKAHPLPIVFERIQSAWKDKSVKEFNDSVATYLGYLENNTPPDLDKATVTYEAFYNKTEIYYYAAQASVIAFILGIISWIGWSHALRSAAFWINVVLLVVHTYGLASRIYISGRPPVTNLYSSAIFIGWGAVALGLLLEWLYPIGIAVVVSSAMGFITLLIAQLLSIDGDTIGVLQAVLDTQFWLATHVVCITFGYATTFLAGFLGIAYFLRGALTKSLTPQIAKDLVRMIYGILCFSIFFSFVGTVLGGLWADDSWGRFWGWDPKENGALIIVLWNALVLHARWGGLVKDRGLAVLAMGGNIATAWSWFGVNELGVGLHSYGFTDGVLMVLGSFCALQLAVILLAAAIPQKSWLSFRSAA